MFKEKYNLTGKGVILGLVDSDFNYSRDEYKNYDGDSKIIFYLDQSYKSKIYSKNEIDELLIKKTNIYTEEIDTEKEMGTICANIAQDSEIIAVKIKNYKNTNLVKSTDIMRAIKFIMDKSLEIKRPVVLNVNYIIGTQPNYNTSIFKEYIERMCCYWKNSIVVSKNINNNKSKNKKVKLNSKKLAVELNIDKNEELLNLDICPHFTDKFNIYLIDPSNIRTNTISLTSGEVKNIIGKTKIKAYFYPISPYNLKRSIKIQIKSTTSIKSGLWKIIFEPIDIVNGNIDIHLQSYQSKSTKTGFTGKEKNIDIIRRDKESKVIYSNSYITGLIVLLMQWGIVNQNDTNLYSNKMKAFLTKYFFKEPRLDLLKIDLDSISNNKSNRNNSILNSRHGQWSNDREYTNNATNIKYGINVIHNGNFENDIKELKFPKTYEKIGDDFGVVFVEPEYQKYISDILNLKSVLNYQINIKLSLLGEITEGINMGVDAKEEIGVNFLNNNPNMSLTGKGVYICIADTGIDYLHEDFIYPDGTSKILYLWDQTKDGKPPSGYSIGTEYTNEDINKAIANKDRSLSVDEEGHGTMISGICAGLGVVNGEYSGVAEDADLIVVKLAKIKGYYTSANLIAATEYFRNKSYKEDLPVVINYSLGGNMAGRTSASLLRNTFFTSDIYSICAAGNEGNTQTHTSGKLKFNGDKKDIELELLEDEESIEINIWIDKPDLVAAGIISPAGELSKILIESDYNPVTGLFDFEKTGYAITYIYPTNYSGQEFIRINLNNAKKGIWNIRLIGNYITNGIYQAYLQNRYFLKPGTKFRDPSPLSTINYPATYENNITVGAFDSINNSLWAKSSRGPSISGAIKPDIIAPAVNIIAPFPGNTYAMITGTAPAAAYVTGASALYMQYVLVDGVYPTKSFSQKLKTYLRAGARREASMKYPNESLGYGVLDVKGVFEQLK